MDDEDTAIRDAVQPVLETIKEAETRREENGEQCRGYGFGWHVGVGLVLQVPSGYEELTTHLAERFGPKLIIEVSDGWRGWAPLTDAP